MINIGVIGYGYWGPNLVRNISESSETTVAAVSDLSPARLEAVTTRYPRIATTEDYRTIIDDDRVDAIAVATPVRTHFEIAMAAIEAGKHVLVEKPMAETSEQAAELVEAADRHNVVLMVDHTFIYTGAVRKLKDLVQSGELGEIYYYDSERVNLGLFQPDVNVIWDLAVHDLAIMGYIFSGRPRTVSATGMGHISGKPANVAFLTLYFDNRMIAHINVNWLAPVKLRRTLIGGDRKMIVYDDLEPSEKIKIYDHGIELEDQESIYQTISGYRMGDMHAPRLDQNEALGREVAHFADSIRNGTQPESCGRSGLYVVSILEAATQSMELKGQPVDIVWRY